MNFFCECVDAEHYIRAVYLINLDWHCGTCFDLLIDGRFPRIALVDVFGIDLHDLERPDPQGEEE